MKFTYIFFVLSLPFVLLINKNIEKKNLRIHDFKCFGALGDSITAGFSINSENPLKSILEYRGSAFPIGGDNGKITIPNLFEKYGGDKICSSKKFKIINEGNKYKSNDYCNSAISGAMANSLDIQVSHLMNELQKNQCENKWKFITIFIGSNDICEICLKDYDEWLYNYTLNLNHTINYLYKN